MKMGWRSMKMRSFLGKILEFEVEKGEEFKKRKKYLTHNLSLIKKRDKIYLQTKKNILTIFRVFHYFNIPSMNLIILKVCTVKNKKNDNNVKEKKM